MFSCRSCISFFFQAEDGIRDYKVTGVQTCALPISHRPRAHPQRPAGWPPWLPGACRRRGSAAGPVRAPRSPARGRRHASKPVARGSLDRKSTRLNSSHLVISYAVFCLKKKKAPIRYIFTSYPTVAKRYLTQHLPSMLHRTLLLTDVHYHYLLVCHSLRLLLTVHSELYY